MVVCQLGSGESLYAEAGKFLEDGQRLHGDAAVEGRGRGPDWRGRSGGMGLLKKAMATATEVSKRALAGRCH